MQARTFLENMTHQLAKYCDSYLIAIPTLCPHLRYPGTVPEPRRSVYSVCSSSIEVLYRMNDWKI